MTLSSDEIHYHHISKWSNQQLDEWKLYVQVSILQYVGSQQFSKHVTNKDC